MRARMKSNNYVEENSLPWKTTSTWQSGIWKRILASGAREFYAFLPWWKCSGKSIPSIQESKNLERQNFLHCSDYSRDILRQAESTSSVAIVEKHSFGCFLDIILNLRLSNDLYIESATIDAISDLFQKFKKKKSFSISGI